MNFFWQIALLGCLWSSITDYPGASAQSGGVSKKIQVAGSSTDSSSTDGVLAGDTLYVSAQNGRNTDSTVPSDVAHETSQAMLRVQDVLRAADMNFRNVVSMHVYVTDAKDLAAMDEAYWKMIGTEPPTRSVLVVANLPRGTKIAISCIASKDLTHKRVIHPTGWPNNLNTDPAGIEVGDVLYMSAQNGENKQTGKIPDDYGQEVKQALDNVAAILNAARMSMANVVWVNPYMSGKEAKSWSGSGAVANNEPTDQTRASVMNKVYASYFEFGNTPGRGTIQVVALPKDAHIVFSCIAGADLAKRKSIQILNMKPSPTASPGVLYRDTYYMSAKSGFIPDQGIVTQDIALQLRQTMRNLLDDLQGAGMDFPDVVQATMYLRDLQYTERVVPLYATFFTGEYPAQTLLQNSFDSKTATGEQISFIAVRSSVAR